MIEFISSDGKKCRNCFHTTWNYIKRAKNYLSEKGIANFYSNDVLWVFLAKKLVVLMEKSEWYIARDALYYKVYELDIKTWKKVFVKYQCAWLPDATFSKPQWLFA